MKNPYSSAGAAVGFIDWLAHPASALSLAIGATCGCDVSRLGRVVCFHLNEMVLPAGGYYHAFGPDDIRQIAGDPRSRHAILEAADRKGIDVAVGCDYECMVCTIAALGGAVLCGEWAYEKSADMDHVFRVSLLRCDLCCPAPAMKLDPAGYSTDGLAKLIARRFLHWSEDQVKGSESGSGLSSALPILV